MLTFKKFLLESIDSFAQDSNFEVMDIDDFANSKEYQNASTHAADEKEPAESSLDEAEFGLGAKTTDFEDSELRDYLDRVLRGERTKKDKAFIPYIHQKVLEGSPEAKDNSYIVKRGRKKVLETRTGKTIDIEAFKRLISQRRDKPLLSQNEKMRHSEDGLALFVNFGIPALVGLAVDESSPNKDLKIVSTCPGAGGCKLYCYALKGGYVQYDATFLKQTRILNFLVNDPEGFFNQIEKEVAAKEKYANKKGLKFILRWHDAGDFFSVEYLNKFYEIARKFPNVEFYAYTKMANIANDTNAPDNVTINFSQGALPSQETLINLKTTKNSRVVPKETFEDLVKHVKAYDEMTGKSVKSWEYNSPKAAEELKRRLADMYKVSPESILTYKQMLAKPYDPKKPKRWNVIVVPGDGDVSASRRDVLGTFLLMH